MIAVTSRAGAVTAALPFTPHPSQEPPGVTVTRRPAATASAFAAIVAVGVAAAHLAGGGIAVYGAGVGSLLAMKMVLSLAPARRRYPTSIRGLRVGVIVTSYNEDPDALAACLHSIAWQTHPAAVTVVVDDGSSDTRAITVARRWAASGGRRLFIPRPVNQGKRAALAAGWRACSGWVDIWCCVDSDTVLQPDAIAEGIRPFTDPKIQATTGLVLAQNADQGLLPALIDLRYLNAFLGERGAYSRLGAVLCCCGSLSFYRAEVIEESLGDFIGQRFLGRPAVFGDDRRLTRYALDRGLVELVPSSVAETVVPERVGHLLRQQVRWGKSFWRETWLMLRTGSPTRVAWWLSGVELVTWAAFGFGLVWAMVAAPLSGRPSAAAGYLLWVCVSSWARSVHVFAVGGRRARWRDVAVFAAAPLYGLLSLLVLLPLRAWSLATLTRGSWGTRSAGVEVTLAAAKAA